MAQPLPFAHDLAADGCDARITGRVIVVLFSTRDCPYCRQVRDGYLAPLAAPSDAAVRVLERRIEAAAARLHDPSPAGRPGVSPSLRAP